MNNNKHIQEEPPALRIIIFEAIRYWYLFAFFMIVFLGMAYLYNKYSAPVYNAGLKLMISTSENSRNRNLSPDEFLQGFQLVQHTKDFENEMVILQSLPLIKETIKDMNLKVSYYYKENYIPFRYWPFYKFPSLILREMYGDVPFEIVINEKHPQPVGVYFYIKIINDKEYSISMDAKDVSIYDYQNDKETGEIDRLTINTKASFGDTLEGSNYSFRVLLNSMYNKEFDNKDLYFSFHNINNLARSYQSRLKVEQSTLEATVVDISFKGQNIQKNLDFLNGLASNYIQRDLTKKNYLVETTIEYIDQELSNISTSLNLAEGQLQYYRKQHQVMDIKQKTLQLSQYIQDLENQKNEMMQSLSFYNELYKYFEENKDSPNMLAPSSMGVNDPVLNTMIQQLATYNAERNTMEEKNLQRNPRYKTLTSQIKDLRNSIAGNIRFYIRSSQSKLEDINANIDRYKLQESQLPQTQTKLLGYERKFNLNNEIYNFLLQKRAEAQIAKASILPDSEIIESANYQGISSPKKLLVFGFALFMALFLPIGYIFLRVYLNNKIRNTDEIKSITDLPILGQILHNDYRTNNILIDQPLSLVSESFRSLRTNLNFLFKNQTKKVILITSSMSEEGKSFISTNLAIVLSLLQKRTILIGFDLRKPSNLFDVFKTGNTYGISNFLANHNDLHEIIYKTNLEKLDIIQAGTPPPNPTELIISEKIKEMMETIKNEYDYVIIDSPPIGLVSDAFYLMQYSDINLFIVRQNFTTYNSLHDSIPEIKNLYEKNIYIVLNDVKPDKIRYSYKRDYAYYTSQNKHKSL